MECPELDVSTVTVSVALLSGRIAVELFLDTDAVTFLGATFVADEAIKYEPLAFLDRGPAKASDDVGLHRPIRGEAAAHDGFAVSQADFDEQEAVRSPVLRNFTHLWWYLCNGFLFK